MTTQQIASITRQVLSVLVSVLGVLTVTVNALHLPAKYAWVSGILVAWAPVLLTLEHYLGDPSTGTPVVGNPAPLAPVAQPPGLVAGPPVA